MVHKWFFEVAYLELLRFARLKEASAAGHLQISNGSHQYDVDFIVKVNDLHMDALTLFERYSTRPLKLGW